MEKSKILVSACLLGVNCKYNCTNNLNEEVLALSECYELIPICPECDGGMPTPRHPSEILGENVINSKGYDVTLQFKKGAQNALNIAKNSGITKAVFKERSPSCAPNFIYDGSFKGKVIKGQGITAKLLSENNIKTYSENEIDKLKTQY